MQNKEKKQGIIAGISLVIMAIVAGFSFGYAHNNLVTDSPAITLQNLIAGKSLFYAELAGWSIIFVLDVIVAIALYYFFRSTSKQISLITAAIRITYTLILGIAIVYLFKIIPILSSTEHNVSETFSYLQLFEKFWSIGLIVFGLHLIGLGYLSVKSKSVHWILGYLLYFGGISYTFIHTAQQLSLFNTEVISSIEKILVLPMTLAEMVLAFWLIYRGFRKSSVKTT
jgi:hypothetical protein